MTALATIAGMIPIAMENAIGLERLSPLADAAIGGLLASAGDPPALPGWQ
jgi:Cu/Ag efflux pump CusA